MNVKKNKYIQSFDWGTVVIQSTVQLLSSMIEKQDSRNTSLFQQGAKQFEKNMIIS